MRIEFDTILGIFLAVLGVALFMPVFAASKFTDIAVPAVAIIWARYLGGIATVSAAIVATRTPIASLRSAKPLQHLLRVALGSTGGVCAVHAASIMPVADAAAVGLSQGLMIVLLAGLILRERVAIGHWLAGSLSALGAYIVIRATATDAAAGDRALEGAVFAFLGAFLIACETLLIKVLARRETALGVLAYVNGMAAILFAIPALIALDMAGIRFADALPFLLLGPLAITAQYCNIVAYRKADAAILGPISYTWILFSTLLGYVWFGEVPGPGTAYGAVLIVAGGVWLTGITVRPRPVPVKIRQTT